MILKPLGVPLVVLLFSVSLTITQVRSQDVARPSPSLVELKKRGVPESKLISMTDGSGATIVTLEPRPARPPGEAIGANTSVPDLATPTEANCERFGDEQKTRKGVVWCGTEPTLDFKVLAERGAPILWFSPKEPLRKKNYNIPQPLPCVDSHKPLNDCSSLPCENGDYCGNPRDTPAVVYYQIRRIVRKRGSTDEPFAGKVLKLDRIQKLTLKYYFYYCVDCGFRGHRHDFENIEMEVLIEKDGPRYRARVAEVIGAAHGVHWYSNRLEVRDNTVFPITILVEEGKHASAPDNDGGGTFEHNSDINNRVRDGWGIRDKLAEKKVFPTFSYYLRGHTNPGRPTNLQNRIGSRAQIDSHPDIWANYCVNLRQPDTEKTIDLRQPQEVYELRELGSDCIPGCMPKSLGSGDFNLLDVLKRRGAGKDPVVTNPVGKIVRTFRSAFLVEDDDNLPENLWEKALQVNYRFDGAHGFSITPTLPMRFFLKGYFVPRIHFTGFGTGNRRYGLDYLYTPSAARWWEVYAAGGIEWFRKGPGKAFQVGPAFEGGFKFRFPLSIGRKLFLGVRFGVRTSPATKLGPVVESGGGLF